MDNSLAVIYLSIFVSILTLAAVSVFRQIFKTRKIESSFAKLRKKLEKEKGTTQEYYELGSIYSEKKPVFPSDHSFSKSAQNCPRRGRRKYRSHLQRAGLCLFYPRAI